MKKIIQLIDRNGEPRMVVTEDGKVYELVGNPATWKEYDLMGEIETDLKK